MAWTKWKTAAAVGAGILLVVGTATVAVKAHTQTARDRAFVRLVSVSVGTNFTYRVGPSKPWIQRLLKALPPSVGSLFDAWLGMGGGGLGLVSYHGETNLAVFTASEQPSGGGGAEALIAFDAQGNSFVAAQGAGRIGSDDGKRFRCIQGWVLRAFPRRTSTLGLRFLRVGADDRRSQPIAEFHIKNPLFAQYPVWVPEPIPATKMDGDLNITLTSLQTGISLEDPSRAAQTNEAPATRAIFQVQRTGRPDSTWRPKIIEISDATGNRWSPFIPADSLKQRGNLNELVFVGALWAGEAAWKLRVEFSRSIDFDADELWTVRGLKVPKAAETFGLQNTTTNHNITLRLVAFTGTDADQPGMFKWLMAKGEPRISVSAEPASEGWRLSLVGVVDDQGREVEVHTGQNWGWSDEKSAFGLKPRPDASSVDCTFALHKSRFVEFLARPAFILESQLRAGSPP